MTQLAPASRVTHVMSMSNEEILVPNPARSGKNSRAHFGGTHPRGPIIDQDGREIPEASLGSQFQGFGSDDFRSEGFRFDGFRFDFGGANPFRNLTREQRLARLDAIAKLLDIAFILPGTKIRYGVDGIIGLIPVVGDLIAAALSLWLVREARALGAPWHITARMLGNVAIQGVVGAVPVAGDAFDVLFRANIRNVRMLRRWMDKQAR
ncbi:protein of unknown function [Bradyrhizobium erythrophlei]|jgi:hypothetical protein|uniref:DUF4112 domain-containing protein n=2 Tax=Bradyrhizobium erythrophlei TaxID=1437360 RepID=A0A1M5M3G4_9BRAD|nr:protein of unknown function [Bradyrhizobium erythrophlei]